MKSFVVQKHSSPFLSYCTVQALRQENVEFSFIVANLKAKSWQKFLVKQCNISSEQNPNFQLDSSDTLTVTRGIQNMAAGLL